MIPVTAVEWPFDTQNANTADFHGGERGRSGFVPLCVPEGQLVSSGHIDHGYAATVHKAQGVTVDRAHVLATPHVDRHAAYVRLTRHRAGVELHYAREDFADPARLARVLGRERAKDTSLDYPGRDGEDLARRYAERLGLDPLRPESEIVVRPERGDRAPERQAERVTEAPTPRRSRFAGLKLKDRAGRAGPASSRSAAGASRAGSSQGAGAAGNAGN